MNLKIEYIDKNELKTYANNAKIHTAEQVEQIKQSIKEFSFNDPIAVWKDNEIIEGHGRLMAVLEMDDITEVPIIRLDNLSDEQRRAYMLVHNKLTMNTDFDVDILNLELQDIVDIDMKQFEFEISIDEESEKKERENINYHESISVVIDCKDEKQAEMIFEKLQSEGYECRISTL